MLDPNKNVRMGPNVNTFDFNTQFSAFIFGTKSTIEREKLFNVLNYSSNIMIK